MQFDPEVEDEGPEEGDGSDRPLASHKAGLSSELFDLLRREKLVQRPLHFPSPKRRRSHRGLRMPGHPIEVTRAGKRPSAREETVSRVVRVRGLTYAGWAAGSHNSQDLPSGSGAGQ